MDPIKARRRRPRPEVADDRSGAIPSRRVKFWDAPASGGRAQLPDQAHRQPHEPQKIYRRRGFRERSRPTHLSRGLGMATVRGDVRVRGPPAPLRWGEGRRQMGRLPPPRTTSATCYGDCCEEPEATIFPTLSELHSPNVKRGTPKTDPYGVGSLGIADLGTQTRRSSGATRTARDGVVQRTTATCRRTGGQRRSAGSSSLHVARGCGRWGSRAMKTSAAASASILPCRRGWERTRRQVTVQSRHQSHRGHNLHRSAMEATARGNGAYVITSFCIRTVVR